MTKKEILEELEQIAQKLSYEISYEALKKTAPYVKSGAVKLNDKKMILVDSDLGVDGKISVILEAIRGEDLEGIFIKPFVKDIIENQ